MSSSSEGRRRLVVAGPLLLTFRVDNTEETPADLQTALHIPTKTIQSMKSTLDCNEASLYAKDNTSSVHPSHTMSENTTSRVRVGAIFNLVPASNQTKLVHQKRLTTHPEERSSRDLQPRSDEKSTCIAPFPLGSTVSSASFPKKRKVG